MSTKTCKDCDWYAEPTKKGKDEGYIMRCLHSSGEIGTGGDPKHHCSTIHICSVSGYFTPKSSKPKSSYADRQAAWIEIHGVKVGDTVEILRKATDHENGWGNVWNPKMDEAIGHIGKIARICDCVGLGIEFANDWYAYPYFVLEAKAEAVDKSCQTCRHSSHNNGKNINCNDFLGKEPGFCGDDRSGWQPIEKAPTINNTWAEAYKQEQEAIKAQAKTATPRETSHLTTHNPTRPETFSIYDIEEAKKWNRQLEAQYLGQQQAKMKGYQADTEARQADDRRCREIALGMMDKTAKSMKSISPPEHIDLGPGGINWEPKESIKTPKNSKENTMFKRTKHIMRMVGTAWLAFGLGCKNWKKVEKMSDTAVQRCVICGAETDCIEGMYQDCADIENKKYLIRHGLIEDSDSCY